VTGIPAPVLLDHSSHWVEVKGDATQSSHIRISPSSVQVTTTIQFDLPAAAIVSMTIYDGTGAVVAKLLDRERLGPGTYEVSFDASSLSTGLYAFTIVAETLPSEGLPAAGVLTMTHKMLLIK
jgi:hypothetical protein